MDLQTWLQTLISAAAILMPVVAVAVVLIKKTDFPSRYYPHASVVAGVAVAFVVAWMRPDLIATKEAGLIGFLSGAMASGLFMIGKSGEIPTTIEKKTTRSSFTPTVVDTVVTETTKLPPVTP